MEIPNERRKTFINEFSIVKDTFTISAKSLGNKILILSTKYINIPDTTIKEISELKIAYLNIVDELYSIEAPCNFKIVIFSWCS